MIRKSRPIFMTGWLMANQTSEGLAMEVRIEEKETFTVTGIGKDFALENCYSQIPLIWQEDRGAIKGVFGVCL